MSWWLGTRQAQYRRGLLVPFVKLEHNGRPRVGPRLLCLFGAEANALIFGLSALQLLMSLPQRQLGLVCQGEPLLLRPVDMGPPLALVLDQSGALFAFDPLRINPKQGELMIRLRI